MNVQFKDTDAFGYINEVKRLNEAEQKKACVITFGCQQNESDSEKIRGMLCEMGYLIVDECDEVDLIIINTCAIRKHAEMKALSLLGRFKALKKKNPDMIIGIVGCMVARENMASMIKNDFHYVSFTVEPGMLHKIPELVARYASEHKRSFLLGEKHHDVIEGIPQARESDFKAWVSIMYGCNNFCTYCIVPYVRGRERSRNSSEIIKECRELAEKGYKEITLLGQNVNSYKSDICFPELLKRIAMIPGDFIVRFMTSHPKDVSSELIEVMKDCGEKIAPYFHLPLQSGSNSVLKAMNRTYDREGFMETVKALRKSIPSIALSSDVIVGFPGEREEDFNDTIDVLEKVRFDMVYSFIYSAREGTKAAEMSCQIPDSVKSDRMDRLLSVQTEISLEKNLPYVGSIQRVLVDSRSKRGECNVYTARTMTNKLVHFKSERNPIGEFCNIKITEAGAFDLFGEIVERK